MEVSLVHIFGNTTLEFPSTVEYAERFRDNHPQAIFLFAKNDEQVFMDVCEDIGPPARMMRWCCSIKILICNGIRKRKSGSK